MRFTVAVVAGFAAMASAATTTASVDSATASYVACLDACDSGDVKCQSYCITVPSPNESQVNATNECVGNCDQGDGTQKETDLYAACVQSCISDNYYKTSSGTPRETDSSNSGSKDSSSKAAKASATGSSDDSDSTASASASASGSDSTDASETESDSESSGTATDAAASATSSDSAASGLVLGSASLVGLFAAVLAL